MECLYYIEGCFIISITTVTTGMASSLLLHFPTSKGY